MNRMHPGALVALGIAVALAACTSERAHPSDINSDLNVGSRGEAPPLHAATAHATKTPGADGQQAVGSTNEPADTPSSK